MDSNFRFRASGDTPHRPRGEAASHRSRLPLRRDPPSGRDLDGGTVSQLLEELAEEMNRPSDRKGAYRGMVTGSGGEIKVGRPGSNCLRGGRRPSARRPSTRRPGRPCRPCREETVGEGGEIEAGLRIILRDTDLEPRVCADPMLIGMAQNLGRPRRQWKLNSAISRHLIYRAIYILTQLAAPGVRRGINPPALST
jgi:hypothetical protein